MLTIKPDTRPFPEQLADDLERRFSKLVLDAVIDILQKKRSRLDVPQPETSAPPAVIQPISEGANLAKPKRRRGRPKGPRRPWTAERKEAHRLKKQQEWEKMKNDPNIQAMTSKLWELSGKPMPEAKAAEQRPACAEL